jgi:hypothetical protein
LSGPTAPRLLRLLVPDRVVITPSRELLRAEQAIRLFAAGLPAGLEHSFGLEAKVAYRLLSRPGVDSPGVALLRKTLLRPASEPIIATYWEGLGRSLGPLEMTSLTSCLVGRALSARDGPIMGAPDSAGVTVLYPTPTRGPDLVQPIGVTGPSSLLASALVRMIEVLLAHPFPDGNGRLARAVWLSPLADGLGLPGPYLPVGPIMKVNAPRVVGAIREVGTGGSIDPFFQVMIDIIAETLALTSQLLARGS